MFAHAGGTGALVVVQQVPHQSTYIPWTPSAPTYHAPTTTQTTTTSSSSCDAQCQSKNQWEENHSRHTNDNNAPSSNHPSYFWWLFATQWRALGSLIGNLAADAIGEFYLGELFGSILGALQDWNSLKSDAASLIKDLIGKANYYTTFAATESVLVDAGQLVWDSSSTLNKLEIVGGETANGVADFFTAGGWQAVLTVSGIVSAMASVGEFFLTTNAQYTTQYNLAPLSVD